MTAFEARDSSNVGWARYEPTTRQLQIDFKDSKGSYASSYAYDEFPPEEWATFCAAPSKGKWFAANIRFHKPPYTFRKLAGRSTPVPPRQDL